MSVIIRKVSNRKELKTFVDFPNKLYKGNPYFVPKLRGDELSNLSPESNPAYKFSEACLWLAYKDGKLAGRIAAIINKSANEKWQHAEVRFGWMDFIDDTEVSTALIAQVEEFGRQRGMTQITGPLGFTDMDAEGLLVEGFDQLSTMVMNYNFPYYKEHIEALGFVKEVDWLEYKVYIPEKTPEKISRVAAIVKQKYDLKVKHLTMRDVNKNDLGRKFFDLINECYSELYNFTILNDEMVKKYVDSYLRFVNGKYITYVENQEGELLAVGMSIPSITRALQKCGGRIFPFGWFLLLRSMFIKPEPNVELLLIAVKPCCRHMGLLALIFNDLISEYQKAGYTYAESNAELENNLNVQGPWEMFESDIVKRRRSYTKSL